MKRFETELVAGGKPPYDTWTFLVVPPAVLAALGGKGRIPVRGTLNGTSFRGTLSRGEGVHRMPVPRALQEQASVRRGQRVRVELERDDAPRPVEIPAELQAVLDDDPELGWLFEEMAPSHRRAWAGYVAEAKKPETRQRRAEKARDGIRARAFPR